MEQHVKVVAILSIIWGILMAFLGIALFGIMAAAGAASGDHEAVWITGAVGFLIAGLFAILALPAILGGVGLLKRRNWGRILVIIVAVMSLLNFPFGTAFGIYAIWALINDQTRPLFT